jgi:hypothetical protein
VATNLHFTISAESSWTPREEAPEVAERSLHMTRRTLSFMISATLFILPGLARANDMCGVVVFQGFGVPTAVNADWARIPLYWDEIEQVPGAYWPSGYVRTDAALSRVANLMPSISGFSRAYQNNMPADSKGAYVTACSAADWQTTLNAWQALWANATSRYCGQIRYWSVWNEPNAPDFLRPRIECTQGRGWCDNAANAASCMSSAAQDYADLVKYADLGRQQGCPAASLVVGEVAQDPYERTFLTQVLSRIAANGVNPAVVSVHTYDTSWGSRIQIGNYRSDVNSYFPGAQIWLTETGGPRAGVPVGNCQASQWAPTDPVCWGGQADFDRAIMNENRQYRAQYNWQRTFIFRSELGQPIDPYGLTFVDGNGNPTDVWGNPSRNLQVDGLSSACGNGLLTYGYATDEQAACNGIARSLPSYCDQIDSGSANSLNVRMMCRGLASHSISSCASITDPNMRFACQGMSSNNSTYCASVTDASQRNFCYGVSARDYNYCYNVTDRNSQLLCFAMANGINSNCRDITLPNTRNFCYGVSAHDASYCASIQSQTGVGRQ